MAAERCKLCGHDRATHGLGTCTTCGCPRFLVAPKGTVPWFVVVLDNNRRRAYGPIARWLDARRLAEGKEDRARGVYTRVVDERPADMLVLRPGEEVR